MKIELPFGNNKVFVDLPEERLSGVLRPKDMPAPADAGTIIREALSHPAGTDVLSNISSRGSRVAVVVDDHTRPTPTREMIAPVVQQLKDSGVRDEDITIIFAVGTHRRTEPEEARRILGREVAAKYRWIAGDCRIDQDFVPVGRTSRGNDVRIFKPYVDADVKVLLGDIEYHYFAGYGGARKSIIPGISHYSTIQFNHKLMFHPNCRMGVLNGNPVHEDMVEGMRLAGVDFCLNVVNNSRGQVFAAFAGSPDQVLRRGASVIDQMYKVPVKERADIVLASAGGHPHDIDLYQSIKAVEAALPALNENGIIVLAAECREGVGNEIYAEWMKKYRTSSEVESALKQEFVLGGHKAYYHLRALEKGKMFLYSAMDKTIARESYMEPFDSVQDALSAAMKENDGKIIVVPYGTTTLLSV